MRTALILMEDANFLNRIKLILRDETVKYHYAGTVDEAVEIMDNAEIAVAMIKYESTVLSGVELIEMIYAKNPNTQIILMFNEEHTTEALMAHNSYRMSKMICQEIFSINDLPLLIEESLAIYNKSEEIRQIEIEIRKKEDKYKKTMREMSELLNDRALSYKNIEEQLRLFIKLFRACEGENLNENEQGVLDEYISFVISDYTKINLLRDPVCESFFSDLESSYSDTDNKRYYKVNVKCDPVIDNDIFCKMAFIAEVIAYYFTTLYESYRGKVDITEEASYYVLNVIYEANVKHDFKNLASKLVKVNKMIAAAYSDKASYGQNEHIIQYKIYFKKN